MGFHGFQHEQDVAAADGGAGFGGEGDDEAGHGGDAAVAGTGVIHLFEDWLRPHLDSGALQPVLKDWWQRFPGPFLYYPGRRLLPAPLRAFVDFVKASRD